jgi:hypothetical protein
VALQYTYYLATSIFLKATADVRFPLEPRAIQRQKAVSSAAVSS